VNGMIAMRLMAALIFAMLAVQALAAPVAAPSPSRSTFVKLMKVQKYWEQEDYDAAIADLEALLGKKHDDPYEFALASQFLAHTYVLLDRPPAARRVLEAALEKEGIHFQLLANLKLFYGQLALGDEEYELARQMFEEWLATTMQVADSSQLFSAAYANYMTQHLDEAEKLVDQAISRNAAAPDSWHRLHYQVLFDLERYNAAELILLDLLERTPANEGFWRLLANHHLRREDSVKALAALTIARQIEVLADIEDLLRIVSLFNVAEAPERGARMLERALADEKLEPDFTVLRRLGDLLLLSREKARAIAALQRAAAVAPDGKTHELLASIWFNDQEWRNAHDAYVSAIEKGGVDNVDRLYLLAGVSAMRAGMTKEAKSALTEASRSTALRPQAQAMLKKLTGET
jgi:tetratricopeptide (TPR) repeat protein